MVYSKNSNFSNNNIKFTASERLILSTSSVVEIEWITNKDLYYPFSKGVGEGDVVKFLIQEKVTESYLKADSLYSHSILLELTIN